VQPPNERHPLLAISGSGDKRERPLASLRQPRGVRKKNSEPAMLALTFAGGIYDRILQSPYLYSQPTAGTCAGEGEGAVFSLSSPKTNATAKQRNNPPIARRWATLFSTFPTFPLPFARSQPKSRPVQAIIRYRERGTSDYRRTYARDSTRARPRRACAFRNSLEMRDAEVTSVKCAGGRKHRSAGEQCGGRPQI